MAANYLDRAAGLFMSARYKPGNRRFGPGGYNDYGSYADRLREEFGYRCAYCMLRERMASSKSFFVVEHVVSQRQSPQLALNYFNLAYACEACNGIKSSRSLPIDIEDALMRKHFKLDSEGKFAHKTPDGQIHIEFFNLNSRTKIEFRQAILASCDALVEKEGLAGLRHFFGYPVDLPDLPKKRPPFNSNPDSIQTCDRVAKDKGSLPMLCR